MKKIREHIDHLFKDFPHNEETESMKQEIIQNLEEKVFFLMERGKAEEDAINKAIVEFGDIEDIRNELGVEQSNLAKKNMSKLNLQYSILGSLLTIALFVFINLYYTPSKIWFVYPTFGVLWWPLTMYFVWLRRK
ncbi:permease prefix domain 1-containing protein [Heyndrickxia ginsengihumi]|uniref:2TM domain-containing protein n=1 Tax=Heyndrickxia ginsengihumi TaxID=363870 RepID=A0A0A6XWT9_9BACI|nr:permease prefix domain 1-containing protein [Heyndrickxia ginsengihumi]KHD84607.1 hypothetical protein NG54_14515 [Heyndrickxia ginsengihumi]MCM3024800.1 permease prefix domain 1-containing protein [Heyndrickxia ginsengihumi]NEY21603.1 hypothetical protein [Heyndrickxia ginsengihumi]